LVFCISFLGFSIGLASITAEFSYYCG
jgi:hypothetical protein